MNLKFQERHKSNVNIVAQDHHHDWTGAIHILNNNSSIDFWDEKKIALAIMNDKDIVVYDNSDFDNFLGYNRSKRSPRQFWTDDRIREAQTSLPKPSRDYFSRLGVETTSDVRLFSTFGAEPARILQADLNRAPWKHYGKLLFKSREGMGACTAAYVHERVLLTAAHCVKQPAYWYSNFIFFHRYNTNSNKGRPIKVKQVFAPKAYDRFNGPGYGDLR